MKKKILLTCLLAMSLVACGTKKDETTKPDNEVSTTENSTQTENNNASTTNQVESVFSPATSAATGAYATIKISSEVKMDDESAWLGLCPTGKDYITEAEADEVDVVWYNADYRENDSDPYVFACDFSDVEDGTYALVVATSDNEEVGYIAIQLEMTKNGDKLTFDYSNAKLKERPAQ